MVFSWNGRLGQTAHCPVDRESRADPVYVSDLSTAEVDARGLFKTTEPATIIIVQATNFLLFFFLSYPQQRKLFSSS